MAETTQPDLRAFQRAGFGQVFGGRRALSTQLEAYVRQLVNEGTDPALVPEIALERMKWHPAVYLAERVVTGVIRRKDLYSVEHEDARIRAETEEWLWPLLPVILRTVARAFAYGARGLVLDWERGTLTFRVPRDDGEGTRRRTLQDHVHYRKAHGLRRSHFEATLENDELQAIHYAGEDYAPDRAFLIVWDPEDEDDTWGNGARRRAWRDYCCDEVLDNLELGYLERSVDVPRVAFAPSGKIEDADGNQVPIPQYVGDLLTALENGGTVVFPMEFDKAGANRLYEVDTLDLPDREEVWNSAISRREARIFMAYLALMGGDAAASAKTLDGLLKEIVQDIAEWSAEVLTAVVEQVHCRNHNPDTIPPPEVEATDVGKSSAKKILTEVMRIVGGEKIASWVDVRKTLDRLNVPVHDSEQESAASAGQPGRPRDLSGVREERREDSITEEGEDATGAEDEGDEQ